MRFDPMTGKPVPDLPIEDNEEEEISFDPMTGQPIRKQPVQAQPEPEISFDPMTGKPVPGSPVINWQETASQGAPTGFDPMTGKPVTGSPVTNQQETALQGAPAGFDPMTGKPIMGSPLAGKTATGFSAANQQETASQGASAGFDPMTGKPLTGGTSTPPKSKNIKIPIIIGCVSLGVAAIAFAIFFALSSGLFLGKPGKVLAAINNTAKKTPRIIEALKPLESICDSKYTISFSGDIEGVSFEGEFRNGGKEKQVSGKADADGSELKLLAGIDGKAARLSVPVLTKYVLTYNYTGKNSGYLMDALDEEEINAINALCGAAAKETDAKKIKSDVLKVYTDEFKSLAFDSVDKEEYEIDGKDVKCAGYQTVITGDNLANIVDGYQKIIEKEFDFMNDSEAFGMDNVTESFDELRTQCEDVGEIGATFYIYKNQLAAVILEDLEYEEKVEICFEGGDYRMQNITIKDGNNRLRLAGETTDKKETFKLEERMASSGGSWREIASLDYAFESGKFTISADGSTVKGKLTSSGSEISMDISEISSYYYNVSPKLKIIAKKGAKMEKFAGKEFDIGNADEDDVTDLQSDISDNIIDEDLDSLINKFGYYW